MKYYLKKLNIIKIDNQDKVLGPIERWQAHRNTVLHRGFTLALSYKDNLIVQRRKHPVFDSVYDISCSSHQIYIKEKIQPIEQAVDQMLKREWFLNEKNLKDRLVLLGNNYYRSKDPNSIYSEHEICYFYLLPITSLPKYNSQYCYGFTLIKKEKIKNSTELKFNFAPWVKDLIRLL